MTTKMTPEMRETMQTMHADCRDSDFISIAFAFTEQSSPGCSKAENLFAILEKIEWLANMTRDHNSSTFFCGDL